MGKYYSEFGSWMEVVDAEAELNKQIGAEGFVLLKNEQSNLPFSGSVRNISVFDKNSVDPVYSGSGSSGGTSGNTISIIASLENAGFHVNPVLVDFYNDLEASGPRRPSMGFSSYNYHSYFPTAETPLDQYTNAVRASYDRYSDAAVIVFSRTGGEGTDLPRSSFVTEEFAGKIPDPNNARAFPIFEQSSDPNYKYFGGQGRESDPMEHYLELDDHEEALLAEVTAKFDKVVVILNSSNVMEVGESITANPKVQSVIWAPGAGQNGFDALGKILNGTVNPSGRTTDTFMTDFTKDPAYQNFANNNIGYYANGTAGNQYLTEDGQLYENNFADFLGVEGVEYEEGIYLGYKYYETRGFTDGSDWYNAAVNYPFGYGLSYITFQWEVGQLNISNGTLDQNSVITVDVTVTNTGMYAGKDVVELYFSAPYTQGKTEKSHVVLGAFEKTKLLRPSESQTVTLTFSGFDMASFDAYDKDGDGHKGYELDAGTYTIYIGRDAHDAWNNGTALTITGTDINIDTDPTTGAAIAPRFTESTDEMTGHTLSRADWEGTFPTTPTEDDLMRSDDWLKNFSMPLAADATADNAVVQPWYDENNTRFGGQAPWYSATAPAFRSAEEAYSAENPAPLQLIDLAGAAYDDPRWDTLVSQLTVDQAYDTMKATMFQFNAIDAIGAPVAGHSDGPVGITGAWVGGGRSVLKSFEWAVKKGGSNGAMSSFNRIGFDWSGANYALLTETLRGEWGFTGVVITDAHSAGQGCMNGNQMIRVGNDMSLDSREASVARIVNSDESNTATQIPLVSNTFNTIFGEERRVLVSGDPSTAQYYTLSDGVTNKVEALAYANSVNERICEEGFVLLKNEDGALPLPSGSKVTVYGMNSVDLVYGGSGSAAKDADNSVDLYRSLDIAGIAYNPEMKSFYESQKAAGKGRPRSPDMGDIPEGFATGELPLSAYSGGLFANVEDYTTAALVVVSHIGGEGYDLPTRSVNTEGRSDETQHYLELDDNEKALLEGLCAEDSPFDRVILIVNCGTSMELDFLRDESTYHGKLKAALWIGTAGGTGMSAMGKALTGLVNPSGRLVDTYAADFTKTPSYQNFSVNNGQGNTYLINGTDQDAHFVDYEEGIYVGYRYYETRGANNEDWYEENVVFPFGYGLSYSTFDWEIEDDQNLRGVSVQKDGTYTLRVKVTNNGPYPGKDVVQLYGHAPYAAGGIEKPEVVLVGFAKTGLLQAYESEVVEIAFNPYYLASYDYQGLKAENGGFVLEAGSGYELYVARNAHDRSFTVPFTVGADIVYKDAVAEGYEVENRFTEVSEHIETYLSRSDWNGTFPTTSSEEERTVDGEFMDTLTMEAYIGQGSSLDADKPWFSARKPRQKRKQQTFDTTEVKLYQLIGKDYDDPLWDRLLGQLTYDEMRYLIGTGNFNTAGLENIDKPKTTDPDGPAGFTNFMTVIDGTATVYDTCFYASECVIAATWNVELVEEMGEAIGNEALIGNERGDGKVYSGWYAPAVNIHRTQFSGRNWEYYSEDSFLSGRMAASVIQGAKSKGVYTYVKHFAVNDQETNRDTNGLITWLNEQSLREIYLRPFEMAVKEGGTSAMMSSFNRIGTVWAGGSYELRSTWKYRF